ncbi:hypothetical protein [Hafnia paralvei]|uniref:hypothetical protein n=1 Tax=Hafnia paralvei TaxID=546367 RepID=UPI0018F05BAD|nr:hypothetical protein [Hafnia paralvei]MBW2958954.1 hypothetical protein [Hafnia paralvei]
MSKIRTVISYIEKHGASSMGEICKGTGFSVREVNSSLRYLARIGMLTKTGDRGHYLYGIPEAPKHAKTKPPIRKKTVITAKDNTVAIGAKKQEIEQLINRGLVRRAQTEISRLIAEARDLDTVNWAMDKGSACGFRSAKYF